MNTTRSFIIITLISILVSLGVGYNVGVHRCRSQPTTSLSQTVVSKPSDTEKECATRMKTLGDECVQHIHMVRDKCVSKLQECQPSTVVISQEWSEEDQWLPSPCYAGSSSWGCP